MSQVQVTLKKSLNGAKAGQKKAAQCLGLKRINQSRVLKDSPTLRGQIKKIRHLLKWEEV